MARQAEATARQAAGGQHSYLSIDTRTRFVLNRTDKFSINLNSKNNEKD
jgi:hypothetical protein